MNGIRSVLFQEWCALRIKKRLHAQGQNETNALSMKTQCETNVNSFDHIEGAAGSCMWTQCALNDKSIANSSLFKYKVIYAKIKWPLSFKGCIYIYIYTYAYILYLYAYLINPFSIVHSCVKFLLWRNSSGCNVFSGRRLESISVCCDVSGEVLSNPSAGAALVDSLTPSLWLLHCTLGNISWALSD